MAKELHHPELHQINLSALYDALSDPVRRQIVARLAGEGELNCAAFADCGSKTRLSYHFARMRDAGLTQTRLEGTSRLIQLRIDDLQDRFPGWLEAVVTSVRTEQAEAAKATGPASSAKGAPTAAARRPAARARR